MIDYQIAKLELQKFQTTDTISSAHGLLCGYACVNVDITLKNWLFEILEEYDKNDDFNILSHIFNNTLEQLSDTEFNFNLLITNDENLCTQIIDLKNWCSGFLTGLGLAKIKITDEEVLDIIKNMSEIINLDNDVVDNDVNANDLTQIIEFVRMGVLLIQETLNPLKQNFIPHILH